MSHLHRQPHQAGVPVWPRLLHRLQLRPQNLPHLPTDHPRKDPAVRLRNAGRLFLVVVAWLFFKRSESGCLFALHSLSSIIIQTQCWMCGPLMTDRGTRADAKWLTNENMCLSVCMSCDGSPGLSSTGTENLTEENFYTFLDLSDVFLHSSWQRDEIFTPREVQRRWFVHKRSPDAVYSMLLSLNDTITLKDTACALQTYGGLWRKNTLFQVNLTKPEQKEHVRIIFHPKNNRKK